MAVVVSSAVIGAGSAVAALPPGSVTVPRHVADQTYLFSMTSSATTVVLSQSSDQGPSRVIAGRSGAMTVPAVDPDVETWFAVDNVLYGQRYRFDDSPFTLVTYDLTTDTQTSTDVGPNRLVAASSAGWVGIDTSTDTLQLHSGSTVTDLATDVMDVYTAAADATGLVGHVYRRDVTQDFGFTQALEYFDFATTTATVLDADARSADLSAGTISWISSGGVLKQRPRAGGATTTTSTTIADFQGEIAVITGGVAYLDDSGSATILPAGGGAPVTTTGLTFSGVVESGGSLFGVVGGRLATAGLYSIAPDGAVARVATPPSVEAGFIYVDVAGGKVYTTDFADSSVVGESQVWSRSVSGSPNLALGAESLLVPRASYQAGIAFSAGRGLIGSPGMRPDRGAYQFVDRGVAGALVVDADLRRDDPALSGPYAVANNVVLRADGRILTRLGEATQGASLFGPLVLTGEDTGRVTLRDLTKPTSSTNPQVLRDATCTSDDYCPPEVAIGGDHAAWLAGTTLTVRNLRTGINRSITVPENAYGLKADVGVLAWVEGPDFTADVITALDTGVANATPQAVGTTRRYEWNLQLDDGLLARVTDTGEAIVTRLPFDHPRAPRLLGVLGTALSPNGDGRGDSWRPQIDLTKALTSATVTIRQGATVVRTLTGTAPDGSIRNIVWDGKNTAGTVVADGLYTWTLTGSAADGDGPVVALDGVSAATGVVTVDRTAKTTTVTPSVTSASGGTTATIPVSWSASADLSGNPPTSYDLNVRRVTVSATGTPVFGAETVWTSTTRSSDVYGAPGLPAGATYQFAARTRDAAGNIGPWSAWASASVSTDDRSLTTTGTWTRETSTPSYAGTLTTSSTANAKLSRAGTYASRITVVGTKCALCGEVKVFVDGALQATVDTHATSTRSRQVVFDQTFPLAKHTVDLVVVGTPGRPSVRLDAVGYLLP